MYANWENMAWKLVSTALRWLSSRFCTGQIQNHERSKQMRCRCIFNSSWLPVSINSAILSETKIKTLSSRLLPTCCITGNMLFSYATMLAGSSYHSRCIVGPVPFNQRPNVSPLCAHAAHRFPCMQRQQPSLRRTQSMQNRTPLCFIDAAVLLLHL